MPGEEIFGVFSGSDAKRLMFQTIICDEMLTDSVRECLRSERGESVDDAMKCESEG